MPYANGHKDRTRARIVDSARELFNIHGFEAVSIDMIMARANLTRGGFYHHFGSKEELYAEAVASFLNGRGAVWREAAGVDPRTPSPMAARRMVQTYLSTEHLNDTAGQCPLIALPSDVARSKPEVRAAYRDLLSAMVMLFENSLGANEGESRREALALAALCVGGMVLARAMPGEKIADEVRSAALDKAGALIGAA